VWPGVVVEENNIQVQVWALRKVLGRRDDGRDYIVTMPGRGYRFCWKPRVESQAPRRRADDALPPLPDKPSIAVLPFANMSEDTARDYFADGVVEDIITLLSRIRWLFVIARNSSFIYKGRAVDIRAVGRELGVRYVLEGSVRFAADRVRITAQLIEAETGSHIWAERYDRPLGDIFDLQDEITSNIVAAIEPNLHSVEIARAKAKPTQSLDAYDLYRRALPELYELTEESCRRADDLLRRALARDPDYADALAALTECITRRWLNGWVRIEEIPAMQAESLRMAQRAVAADPQNGIAIATAAYVFACHMRRFDSALEYAERALQLHPNSAHVRSLCAGAFIQCGESERAIAQYNVTLRLNPVDPRRYLMFTGIAMAHFFAYRFEEAAHWARRSLDEKPEWAGTRRYHAAALAQLGRIEEARDEIAELLLIQPNSSIARSRANSFRHDWMYDLYLGALRAAGLPES
jgi:adenylate cyclase